MTSMLREPVYELVSADGTRPVAEAESLNAILLAAQTIADEGVDLGDLIVMKAGQYDPATTALIQENLI